eukprot:scaffold2380_cov102-Isochrysis_galbana.AAC.8
MAGTSFLRVPRTELGRGLDSSGSEKLNKEGLPSPLSTPPVRLARAAVPSSAADGLAPWPLPADGPAALGDASGAPVNGASNLQPAAPPLGTVPPTRDFPLCHRPRGWVKKRCHAASLPARSRARPSRLPQAGHRVSRSRRDRLRVRQHAGRAATCAGEQRTERWQRRRRGRVAAPPGARPRERGPAAAPPSAGVGEPSREAPSQVSTRAMGQTGHRESRHGGRAQGKDRAVRVQPFVEPVAAGSGVVTEGGVGWHRRRGADAAKSLAPLLADGGLGLGAAKAVADQRAVDEPGSVWPQGRAGTERVEERETGGEQRGVGCGDGSPQRDGRGGEENARGGWGGWAAVVEGRRPAERPQPQQHKGEPRLEQQLAADQDHHCGWGCPTRGGRQPVRKRRGVAPSDVAVGRIAIRRPAQPCGHPSIPIDQVRQRRPRQEQEHGKTPAGLPVKAGLQPTGGAAPVRVPRVAPLGLVHCGLGARRRGAGDTDVGSPLGAGGGLWGGGATNGAARGGRQVQREEVRGCGMGGAGSGDLVAGRAICRPKGAMRDYSGRWSRHHPRRLPITAAGDYSRSARFRGSGPAHSQRRWPRKRHRSVVQPRSLPDATAVLCNHARADGRRTC